MTHGLVVDLFAGGGGASIGMEAALGIPVNHAVNHDELAITVHRRNHPATTHYARDVFEVDPLLVTQGQPVDYLWASPDCTHHSIARGGRPRESGIRALAWVVVDWLRKVRPMVGFVENVKEFMDWGPLDDAGQPIKSRRGETFNEWVAAIRELGYRVEWRVLDASQYGAPTRRMRFFAVMRRDGSPVVWPKPTHGPGLAPFRTAAECIDWSLPCPSIFLSAEEARAIGVRRPLKQKTMWRIANGVKRYVLEAQKPFIVRSGHYSNITGEGGTFRGQGVDVPLGTVCAQGNDKALVLPALMKFRGDSSGQSLESPMPTITGGGSNMDRPVAAPHALGLAVPVVVTQQHTNAPKGVCDPLPTITTQGNKSTLVNAFVVKHFGGMVGHPPTRPIGAITAKDHHGIAEALLSDTERTTAGVGFRIPQVRAFLTAYYGGGSTGQELTEPLRTITAKARLGLVTIEDVDYQIVDIGMRMLEPHELLLAQFGEFAEHFSFDVGVGVTKAQKVRLIGNSVPPHVVKAIVEANKTRPDSISGAA